jgi:hypothetical protein
MKAPLLVLVGKTAAQIHTILEIHCDANFQVAQGERHDFDAFSRLCTIPWGFNLFPRGHAIVSAEPRLPAHRREPQNRGRCKPIAEKRRIANPAKEDE